MSVNLTAETRTKLGSRPARYLRLAGRIPCSIFGEGKSNLAFSIVEDQFLSARRAHEHLFDFEVQGGGTETGIVRELQWDAFGERIIHVEFRRVVRGKETDSEVELTFRGRPKGGVLNTLVSHVTITCLPSDIPDGILVKVEGMQEGDSIQLKDLPMPQGVRIASVENPEEVVAAVIAVSATIETTDEEEPEAEPEQPEAIRQKESEKKPSE